MSSIPSVIRRLAILTAVVSVNLLVLVSVAYGQCTSGNTPKPGCLGPSTVAQVAHQYFNPTKDTKPFGATSCDDLVTAIAVAGMESDFYAKEITKNPDGSSDFGLWQSNDNVTDQAPAPNACGVGSARDFDPTTALNDLVCQMTTTNRGFNISNAYRTDRFTSRQKDWA